MRGDRRLAFLVEIAEARSRLQNYIDVVNRQIASIQEESARIKAQEAALKKSLAALRRMSFLRGVGSLVDLCPDPTRYQRIIPTETVAEELAGIWTDVGDHIRRATEAANDEHQEERP